MLGRGFLLDNSDAGLEIRRRDIGNQTGLEAVAQAIFQSRNVARNLVRGEYDLMAIVMERVERVEEFFLRALATGQELNVIQDQRIHAPELLLEFAHSIAPQRTDELVHEDLGRHEQNLALVITGLQQVMADGGRQVRLAEADSAVDKQR